MYMFQYYCLNLPHPLLPLLCPQVCFLNLCLHCFPANRSISTIFLDSIYMHSLIYTISFSFCLSSLCVIGSRFIHLKAPQVPCFFSSVQSLSCVWLFVIPYTIPCQASLSITISWSLLKFMSIELVIQSNHLILCWPFSSCLQSFPASGSFLMSEFFALGGQSIGALASASMNVQDWFSSRNIQDWFPLGWTGLISLQSKGLSRVFSNTTVQKHQFFGTQLSL